MHKSPHVLPKYVCVEKRKTSRPVHRIRIPGISKSIKLNEEPGTPEYYAEHAACVAKLKEGFEPLDKRRKINNYPLRQVLNAYEKSSEFKALKQSTRAKYINSIKCVRKHLGNLYCNQLAPHHITKAMSQLNANAANLFLRTLRNIINWAHNHQYMDRNPTTGLKNQRLSDDGFPAWTDEEIKTFEDHWPIGTKERLAFDLLKYTGLSVAQILELGPEHIKNESIIRTCKRTDVEIELEFHPALRESIQKTPTGTKTFLTVKSKDEPFSNSNYFGLFFRTACKAAGLRNRPGQPRNLSPHGLRKTAAVTAVKNGAEPRDVIDALGLDERTLNNLYDWKQACDQLKRKHKISLKSKNNFTN